MAIAFAYEDFNKVKKRRGAFKNTSKEERARCLHNIICPRCSYHNKDVYIKKYGKCHLCGAVLDKEYFKKMMLRRLKNG